MTGGDPVSGQVSAPSSCPPMEMPPAAALPEVTVISVWQVQPGDRLVVKIRGTVADPVAANVKARIRARLNLPTDLPIMVLGDGEDLQVIRG
jgi:hypothetical protein